MKSVIVVVRRPMVMFSIALTRTPELLSNL